MQRSRDAERQNTLARVGLGALDPGADPTVQPLGILRAHLPSLVKPEGASGLPGDARPVSAQLHRGRRARGFNFGAGRKTPPNSLLGAASSFLSSSPNQV